HRSVRLVILVGLAIDQIAQSGLSSLSVIYYSAQLFSRILVTVNEAKPDEQLKAEFDKVNLDHSVRVAKCAQLVAGNAARADDADINYLN
ncbi:hypothetical protein, partial [Citrobacter freundii]|uniref:hypothetical protein n=1 Tax=Citrobacter freundii TaxID=546 RepID=UPI004042AB17